MQQWEYLIVVVVVKDGNYRVIRVNSENVQEYPLFNHEYMNQLGIYGWELVLGTSDPEGEGNYIFKRPIQQS